MNYQDGIKKCAYCGKEFKFLRISAKYCSRSCASMDGRRKNNPNVYRHYNPVHLEYDDEAFRALKKKAAEKYISDPKEYLEWIVEQMITKNMFTLFFNEEEENILKYVLKSNHPNKEFQVAFTDWIKERSEKEAIAIKTGKKKGK